MHAVKATQSMQAVLGVIRDAYKSKNEICKETGLSFNTVNNAVTQLEKQNLLLISSRINHTNREWLYKIKSAKVYEKLQRQ